MFSVSPAFVFPLYGTGFTVADFRDALPRIKRLGFSAYQPEIYVADAIPEWLREAGDLQQAAAVGWRQQAVTQHHDIGNPPFNPGEPGKRQTAGAGGSIAHHAHIADFIANKRENVIGQVGDEYPSKLAGTTCLVVLVDHFDEKHLGMQMIPVMLKVPIGTKAIGAASNTLSNSSGDISSIRPCGLDPLAAPTGRAHFCRAESPGRSAAKRWRKSSRVPLATYNRVTVVLPSPAIVANLPVQAKTDLHSRTNT